ncbi:hypothetical protein L6452_31899 [Arctium lappa]|uniref:Uncharacterized protein n=1 Tax=Arctium lappa TaxID=4217 RepID=A0ACB8Z2Z8_ARCLA|nr:hypothetical protein L6452_31899 [Arctium lappa]
MYQSFFLNIVTFIFNFYICLVSDLSSDQTEPVNWVPMDWSSFGLIDAREKSGKRFLDSFISSCGKVITTYG